VGCDGVSPRLYSIGDTRKAAAGHPAAAPAKGQEDDFSFYAQIAMMCRSVLVASSMSLMQIHSP
jgi:hypothetical protein